MHKVYCKWDYDIFVVLCKFEESKNKSKLTIISVRRRYGIHLIGM